MRAGGTRPSCDNALIYWLLDDPAVAERYRAIVRELAETVFTASELNRLIEEAEKAVPARDKSTREFLRNRAAYMESAVDNLPK
ncbi:MAG TPA: CotH kinase family protein [Terriglobia bacterium]|nr:CotH kinase family protein [Terriglobia bacterium]